MARRKRQSSPQSLKTKSHPKRFGRLYVAIAVTLVLAGIPFALGKYIELNSPGPYDSGAYVYSAKHLLSGARLGVDETSSAQPETLIVNIIGVKLFGFNDRGPKIVQMILQLTAGIFMFYTLRRVFGSVAAVIGTTIAAIYLSAPAIAKYGNVKEQFMIAFMLYTGCSFLLYEFSQKRFWLLLAGFFALQPFYFKATGLSVVIAIILYMLMKNAVAKKWKLLYTELLSFLIGYTMGFIIPLSLFIWQRQPGKLLHTFPAIAFQLGLLFLLLLPIVIYAGRKLFKLIWHYDFKKVPKRIWITGIVLIVISFAVSIIIIQQTEGFLKSDVCSYIHSIPFVSVPKTILYFIFSLPERITDAAGLDTGYLTSARAAINIGDLAKKIGRYYMTLKVPILLASASIVTALLVWISGRVKKITPSGTQSRVIWMLAIWWILDMAFIWVSPRSYEQYYLPLCASAAMLSGYVIWKWNQKLVSANNKMPWLTAGFVTIILLAVLSIPIFAGQRYSPDTGAKYKQRQRGFAQSLTRVNNHFQQYWQILGDYIRTYSTEDDTIYVWGWVPGIYVQAQRLAPVPRAFESDMHIKPPKQLKGQIRALVAKMKKEPPKFIVDTRKRHIPWNRPPLELWPVVPAKLFGNKKPYFLRNDKREITAYDTWYSNELKTKIDKQEALRYQAMKPLRDFVMTYYKPVNQNFGDHRLYERIAEP